ncbi:MAG: chemotaxis protein CheW [Candidatus Stygibacter frigidus]|nr:chemotaxis protein CheW [Candidatus Stygibacter frigidus]
MAKSESYLVFREGEHRFGLSLTEVERIEKAAALEEVNIGAEFVKGVLNYHGELLAVVDIRKIFRLKEREDKITDLLIIASTNKRRLAIWAESVEGVIEKKAEEIEDAQRLYLGLEYVKGVFKFEDNLVLLSDLEKFISERELKKLHKYLEQEKQ